VSVKYSSKRVNCLVTGIAGCGATVVHDLVYNPAEGKLFHFSMFCCLFFQK